MFGSWKKHASIAVQHYIVLSVYMSSYQYVLFHLNLDCEITGKSTYCSQ